jgi:hypothetical protein
MNSISWIDCRRRPASQAHQSAADGTEPASGLERLFGSGATPDVRSARLRQNRSILD